MKIVINPKYYYLEGFINTVLERNYKADATYRAFRNVVEDVTVDGVRLVVKIFKKPTECNRIVYTCFRKTKARRSYEKSFQLLDAGILVPEPVAYIEKRKGLFFHTGCFISVFIPHRAIDDFVDYKPETEQKAKEFEILLDELAEFAVDMHSKGIIHNDFNKDNILYRPLDINESGAEPRKHFEFALIDLNRVKFNDYSLCKAAKDLSNIHLGDEINNRLCQKYCHLRNIQDCNFCALVHHHAEKYDRQSHLKDIFLGPLGLRKHRNDTGYVEESK